MAAGVHLLARILPWSIVPVLYGALLTSTASHAAAAIVTVTSDGDSREVDGAVTLREALDSMRFGEDLNDDVTLVRSGVYGSSDEIRFAIGFGAQVIAPATALPMVGRALVVDGSTQPGWVDEPVIAVDGAAAPAGTDGLTVGAHVIASILHLEIREFPATGISLGAALLLDGFESGDLRAWAPPPPSLVVGPSTLSQLRVSTNGGSGIGAFGHLEAAGVQSRQNGGDGFLVASADPVTLTECESHDNGGAGVRVLRTDDDFPGLEIRGGATGPTSIHDNAGDGIVLGDPDGQQGAIEAYVHGTDLFANEAGIRVRQHDDILAYTAVALFDNRIVDNRASGLHVSRSFWRPRPGGGRPISSNEIRHNAMADAGCSVEQSAPQVYFHGHVANSRATCATEDGNPAGCAALYASGESCVYVPALAECHSAYDMGNTAGPCMNSNTITGYYNASAEPLAVGVRAEGGAVVVATQNDWFAAPKVSTDGGSSLIVALPACDAVGCQSFRAGALSLSDAPPSGLCAPPTVGERRLVRSSRRP